MSTQRMTRKVRNVDKTRSSSSNSINHPDSLIEPMMSLISSTFTPLKIKSENNLPCIEENQIKPLVFDKKDGKSKFFPKKILKKTELSMDNLHKHPFRNLIFSPDITVEQFKDHLSLTQRGLIYSKACLKQPSSLYLKNKFINLSEKKRKNTKKRNFINFFGERL